MSDFQDHLNEDALLLEPRETYDKAVVGFTQDGLAIYDVDKVIEAGIEIYGDHETSLEWHDFNTFSTYMGEGTPVFMNAREED